MRLFILVLALILCLATTTPAFTSGIQELVGFPWTSTSCPYGSQPAAIIQASDGNFYGVAQASTPGGGTIFKMTPSGQLTELFVFLTQPGTAFFPNGSASNSIAEGSDGLLYGTAGTGGPTSASSGTLWRIHKDGTGFQVLQPEPPAMAEILTAMFAAAWAAEWFSG
jgi:hypothetical protein